ncbi:MAG: dUTP diphosphatase [Chloroflexota bacterium]
MIGCDSAAKEHLLLKIPYARPDRDLPATHRPFDTDAGTDVYAAADTPLASLQTVRVPLNMALALPDGYYAMLAGRSSTAARGLLVHVGTVDSGYRGQLFVAVTNVAGASQMVRRGDRIAQLVVLPFISPEYTEVDQLEPSPRGERGWGSSGR